VRIQVRVSLIALVVSALAVLAAPVVAQAFTVETFFAGNCKVGHEHCASTEVAGPLGTPYSFPKEPATKKESEEEGFSQAGGRVPFGVTDFELKTEGTFPDAKPVGGAAVNHVRVDVAKGLATSPVAVPMCSLAEFGETEAIPTSGLYLAPKCKSETEIGTEQVTIYNKELEEKAGFGDLPLAGKVYNLVQPAKLASYYGVALAFPKALTEAKGLGTEQYYLHSFVKGSVEWGKQAAGTDQGDYHDYFEVEVNPADPLISSRQVLFGTAGNGAFITNGTSCPGDDTTYVTLKDTESAVTRREYTTRVGLLGCKGEENALHEKFLELPFAPTFTLSSSSTLSDQPNAITTELAVPHNPKGIDSSQVKTASVTLPEGMTLNPPAARGLEVCTKTQAQINSEEFGTKCPAGSEIGTVTLEVPTLPAGSLTGSVYLGGPESGPITGPPYTIYVVANSERYGVSVRLKGEVVPNAATGQLTTIFNENPEQPFSALILHFNRGKLTSVANPLICGTPMGSSSFVPTSGSPASQSAPAFGASVTGCAASVAFAPTQSTASVPNTGGSESNFIFTLKRPEGQQYVEKLTTTLPPGVVGKIPSVTQCTEAQANATQESGNGCPAASLIGSVNVTSGSGEPVSFAGNVYLTEKYAGAPYGLAFKVPVEVGPFKFTEEVTRATISVNQSTARVTVAAKLPTIKDGIPIRLRSMTVDVDRPNYILNPTNCGEFKTESVATSALGTVNKEVFSPFQVEGCGALPFKPGFTASTSGKASKPNGASLVTTMTSTPGQSNIKSVLVQLPKQLPSRLTTLQKACILKTFEENPFNCSKESMVGTATAATPVLPNVMKGPAILVSHAGEEFPSLELVLEADGVRVIVEGKTHIKNGITTTNFAATPDVPVSSITVSLPLGPFSALALERPGKTNLCTEKLVMPTTITGQNGVVVKQNTAIAPTECGVQILKQKVKGNAVEVTVETYAAGRVSLSGSGLTTTRKTYTGAKKSVTIKVPLSRGGRGRRRPFTIKVRAGFTPTQKGAKTSSASVSVKFKR
jgi:hypothetical protein